MNPEEQPSLEDVLAMVNKKHGAGTAMRAVDKPLADVAAVSTGSIDLDRALGIGGLPLGRIVEIYGPESSGKTTIALQVIANAQRAGADVAMIDAEHALDMEYASNLGADTAKLIISQPDSGEQALDVAEQFIASGRMSVVVIDSVAALVPRAELAGEMGDSHVGQQARLMGQAIRKLTPMLAQHNTLCIFINQIREKIGVMFGSPETTPGGRALPFAASVRLDIRRKEAIKIGDVVVGNKTRVTVKKNKMAPPFKLAEFDILYGIGVNLEGEIIDLGVQHGLIKKAGAFYSLASDNTRLGQGRSAACEFLRDNTGLAYELEQQIRTILGFPT